MKKKQQLLYDLTDSHDGYFMVKEAVEAGISRPTISSYLKRHQFLKISPGLYKKEETWDDPLFALQQQYPETIYTGSTALYQYGLLDREPDQITVTVKKGYNALRLHQQGIRTYYIEPVLFRMGCSEQQTFYGHTIKMYDMDRTVCDLIRHKKDYEIQDFQTGIKSYFRSRNKNLNRLMEYAKKLRIENKIQLYVEVLL